MHQGILLLSLIAWISWLSVTCDKSKDVTQNWRRWSHIQWAAGSAIVFASPSWQFSILFGALTLAYWLPWVEAKSGALNDWFIKVFLFGAFYAAMYGKLEKWMLPWLLLFIVVCCASIAFWIAAVKVNGPKYVLSVFGRKFPCLEMWPERDEPTPGGMICHGRMMNPVHSGAFGSVAFFASLGLGAIWHPAWYATAALGVFVLWGSGSRGGAFNLIAGSAMWIAVGGPHSKWIAVAAAACGLAAVWKKFRDWSWGSNLSSWRFHVWRDSVRLCLGNPLKSRESCLWWLIGVGPFGWQDIAEKNLRKYGDRTWLSPHNEFVHILCEHGLIGLAASLAFIAWTLAPSASSGGAYGAAYLGVAGALIATSVWSFPWRGTGLIEGSTGRFLDAGIIKAADGTEKKVIRPEIGYASAGAPVFTWLTAIWAILGPRMG